MPTQCSEKRTWRTLGCPKVVEHVWTKESSLESIKEYFCPSFRWCTIKIVGVTESWYKPDQLVVRTLVGRFLARTVADQPSTRIFWGVQSLSTNTSLKLNKKNWWSQFKNIGQGKSYNRATISDKPKAISFHPDPRHRLFHSAHVRASGKSDPRNPEAEGKNEKTESFPNTPI